MPPSPPPLSAFTPAERRLIRRLNTPARVQAFINAMPYNNDDPPRRDTFRSFRRVARLHTAHCAEAALAAACILEQHGYPPLLLSLESVDLLDHVLFLYRRRGRWGTVAASRDPGLFGRKPVFRTLRALVASYIDAYVDATGCIEGYACVDLRMYPKIDWRFSRANLWALERTLTDIEHTPVRVPAKRVRRLRKKYLAYRARNNGKKPLFYRGRETWSPIPREFR